MPKIAESQTDDILDQRFRAEESDSTIRERSESKVGARVCEQRRNRHYISRTQNLEQNPFALAIKASQPRDAGQKDIHVILSLALLINDGVSLKRTNDYPASQNTQLAQRQSGKTFEPDQGLHDFVRS
jgi:hypothetical protein